MAETRALEERETCFMTNTALEIQFVATSSKYGVLNQRIQSLCIDKVFQMWKMSFKFTEIRENISTFKIAL